MRHSSHIIGLLVLLSGCTSGYEDFYVDESHINGHLVNWQIENESPIVYESSGDFARDNNLMWEQGYARIGYSSFNGSLEGKNSMIEQAKKIGAHAIVSSVKFTGSTTTSVPITTSKMVTTNHSGTVYSGSHIGSYSGTSTSYVPSTSYIPMTVRRYDQTAGFFAKLKPSCLGILVGYISNEERRNIGTNQGVKVSAVRVNSPIYMADIVPGDIVIKIDGNKINDRSIFSYPLKSNQKINLGVYRNGTYIEKELTTGMCL